MDEVGFKGRPIFSPEFWHERLVRAVTINPSELYRAIYRCTIEEWNAIEKKHRKILAQHIQPTDSILDVGCGYGRILDMLPLTPLWTGGYLGIDISPDFINLARDRYTGRTFYLMDARDLFYLRGYVADNGKFDLAIMLSFRPMVLQNMGREIWDAIESNIRACANRLLYLEMDPKHEGLVE